MKKFVLAAVLAASATTLHAQSIEAGTVSVGGSIGYSHFSSDNATNFTTNPSPYNSSSSKITSNQFSFGPSVSYFVADNLAIGLAGGVSKGSYDERVTYMISPITLRHNENSFTSYSIGPYVQYYKMLTAQFGLTGRLGGGYQHTNEMRLSTENVPVDATYRNEVSNSGYYANLTPGIIFLPVPRFGISATIGSLGFEHSSFSNAGNSISGGISSSSAYSGKGDFFGARFGLDYLQFGGTYYFGR